MIIQAVCQILDKINRQRSTKMVDLEVTVSYWTNVVNTENKTQMWRYSCSVS